MGRGTRSREGARRGEQQGYTKGYSRRRKLHLLPRRPPNNSPRPEQLPQPPRRSPARVPRPVQFKVFEHREGGGEDLYLNATLSRSLRHVSQRERSGSSQFFSTFLSSPQPRSAPRPAGRGHLRSFLQHLSRQPPRGSASARGGAGRPAELGARGGGGVGAGPGARRRGLQVAARRGDPGRSPAGLPLSPPTRGRRPRPLPSRRSPSLSRMFSFLEERN